MKPIFTASFFCPGIRCRAAVPVGVAVLAVGIPLLAGCGGGGGHTAPTVPGSGQNAAQGRVALTIVWPVEDTRPSREIPSNTDKLVITLTTTTAPATTVISENIPRGVFNPDKLSPDQLKVNRTYTVPAGSYTLKCIAQDPNGAPLASGAVPVTVTAGASADAPLSLKSLLAISGGLVVSTVVDSAAGSDKPLLFLGAADANNGSQTLSVSGKDTKGNPILVDGTKVVWYVSDSNGLAVGNDGAVIVYPVRNLPNDGLPIDPNTDTFVQGADKIKVDYSLPGGNSPGGDHSQVTITGIESTRLKSGSTTIDNAFYLTARYKDGTEDTVRQSLPIPLTVKPVFKTASLSVTPVAADAGQPVGTLNQSQPSAISITAYGATANDSVTFTVAGNPLSPIRTVDFTKGITDPVTQITTSTFSTTFTAPALPGINTTATLTAAALLNGDTAAPLNQNAPVLINAVALTLAANNTNILGGTGFVGNPFLVNAGESVVTFTPTLTGAENKNVTFAITSGGSGTLSTSSVLSNSQNAVTFTAPYTPGLFEITATSIADPSKKVIRYIQVPTGKVNITLH